MTRGTGTGFHPVVAVVLTVAALALAYGLILRVWLLVQLPIWGDEAIVGIMARAIDGGHFTAFYLGQNYGGFEPYLVALGLKVGGGGEPAMNATPAVLAAVAAGLVGGLTYSASRNRPLALAAAAAAWVWPYVVIWQSVREGGFREATLCCGVTALLCCVRVYRRRAGPGTFLLLGLALGLGWWASPEIGYFALPALVLLAAWWWAVSRPSPSDTEGFDREPTRWVALALVVAAGFVGSLPWWYANAHSGFASLQSGSLPANGGATYGERFSVFFHYMLPMQLGVRTVVTGNWVGGPTIGKLLYGVVLALTVAAVVWAVWIVARRRASLVPLALAVGVVAYPFLYAAAPGTAFWNDGRYGIYLPTLIVLLFATVLTTFGVRTPRSNQDTVPGRYRTLALAAAGVLGVLGLTVAGAAHGRGPGGLLHELAQRRCSDGAGCERHAGAPHHGRLRRLLDRLRPRLLERGTSDREPVAAGRQSVDVDCRRGRSRQPAGLALLRSGPDGAGGHRVSQPPAGPRALYRRDLRGASHPARYPLQGGEARDPRRRSARTQASGPLTSAKPGRSGLKP